MTPFERWFSADWQKLMQSIPAEPGVLSNFTIDTASWDRKAAYLLWDALGRPNAAWVDQMHAARSKPPAAPAEPDDLLALPADPEIEDLLSL